MKQTQAENQREMSQKLEQLERDVHAGQDVAAERVVKKLKRDRGYEFKKKGHEKQYLFNDDIKDKLDSAAALVAKVTSTNAKDKEALDNATKELKEGVDAILVHQKLIRLADRSEFGWDAVNEYETDELASSEDDAKRLEKAEKAAKQKALKRKKAAYSRGGRGRGRRFNGPPMGQLPPPPSSSPGSSVQPLAGGMMQPRGASFRYRVPGPCFNCLEMGHLKANCPKLVKLYPLSNNVVSAITVVGDNVSPSNVVSPNVHVCTPESVLDDYEVGCISRFWESEQGVTQIMDVQGSLREKLSFWEHVLKAPSPIIECIRDGYKLPLLSTPAPFSGSNQSSALESAEFVTSALSELLVNRCIRKVNDKPRICSPLSVVRNSEGKERLVLNLRYLNRYLYKESFKYEDIRVALLLFQKGDYMFSFDLKSGYHHVDIHRQHWEFLGFSWGQGPNTGYYVFCVLPFGLSTACYLFTKLMRPLVKYWRQQGLRIVLYLDDGIVAVQGEQAALTASKAIQEDLNRAGLVANSSKCCWEPAQQCSWLGFNIDLAQGKIAVPQVKLSNLHVQLQQAIQNSELHAKYLASIIGKIISMSVAIGPVTRLMTRSLYGLLNTRQAWCDMLAVTPEARAELEFWLCEIAKFNGQDIWPSPSAVRVVYTDASLQGYGGYTVEHGCHIAHGHWLQEEANKSSTWRELRAVRQVLEAFASKLRNERVRWFTDNQNVTRIIATGSKKPDLQAEALAIFSTSVANNIRIEPEWIPREENELADYLSRIVDHDDWSLDGAIFQQLDHRWGPHTIDRFATHYNTQLPRFNSRFWNPGTEGVDAFTCDWSKDMNWLCPPVFLIPRVLRHASKCHARGTLVVPEWPSAPFWPIIFPTAGTPASFITDSVVLDKADLLLHPGRTGANLFHGEPNTNFIALQISFQVSPSETL